MRSPPGEDHHATHARCRSTAALATGTGDGERSSRSVASRSAETSGIDATPRLRPSSGTRQRREEVVALVEGRGIRVLAMSIARPTRSSLPRYAAISPADVGTGPSVDIGDGIVREGPQRQLPVPQGISTALPRAEGGPALGEVADVVDEFTLPRHRR